MTRFRWAALAGSILLTVHVVWLVNGFGGDGAVTAFSDLIQIVPPAAAAVGCWLRARREAGAARLAWRLLAASQGAWALGAATWSLYEVALGAEVPFPSLADLGFLATIPLAAAGILAFPGAPRRLISRIRTLLDGVIIGGSVLFISWATVLGPTYRAGADSLLHQILALAYPLGDVALVTAVVFVAARAGRGGRLPFVLVGAGLLLLGITDSAFIYLDLAGAYSSGSLIDAGWTLAPYLVFLGALAFPKTDREEDHGEHVDRRLNVMLPYAAPALAVVTAVAINTGSRTMDSFLVWLGISIGIVIGLRQMATLFDNLALSRNLEVKVDERTAELRSSEERFRSLVQNSSDVIAIVDKETAISYVSQSVERIFGLRPPALVGRPLAEEVHGEDRPTLFASLADALNHPAVPIGAGVRMRHRDGHWSRVEITLTNLTVDPSVGGIVLNIRDVTERWELEEQLSYQALHDPLTGLANRAVFRDRVAQALRRSTRHNEPLAVIFLDLDGFKSINDSFGHPAGDSVLVEVGRRLSASVRPGDTVARLGGDEFALLVEDLADAGEAETVAKRIIDESRTPFTVDGRHVFVRASIGIALRENRTDDAELLMRNADVAMYIAKARGKGRAETFRPDMHAPVLARLETEAELRSAIENGDLRLVYQPIVDLRSGRVESIEALIRWEHPERGLIPPDEFIPVAEESGLIHAVGEWVLNRACSEVERLQRSVRDPVPVAVNLSAMQFQAPDLPRKVAEVLNASGLPAELLTLEITESAVMADSETTVHRLHELKQLGVRLAIDDFGTGYSSLSYLRRFPVDVLKIDRSFIAGIDLAAEASALARAILKLAQTFHVEAIAEGIERPEQLEALRRMGCRHGQGYYFARPMPLDDLLPMLASGLIDEAM